MKAEKEIKSGLKLVRTKTDVATHTCKLFLRKEDEHLDNGYQYSSFVNFYEIKVCSKTWAYFTMKSGWLKTSAGTTKLYVPNPPLVWLKVATSLK